ncbi:hypothetical protein BHM03_00062328 [Ensete ventricosum]|nr:hypothetical protein BHM03_00062328 [Ensete ventricosum]
MPCDRSAARASERAGAQHDHVNMWPPDDDFTAPASVIASLVGCCSPCLAVFNSGHVTQLLDSFLCPNTKLVHAAPTPLPLRVH